MVELLMYFQFMCTFMNQYFNIYDGDACWCNNFFYKYFCIQFKFRILKCDNLIFFVTVGAINVCCCLLYLWMTNLIQLIVFSHFF